MKIENDIAEKKSGALASKALSDYNNDKYKTL
jgi:hypothetical protein